MERKFLSDLGLEKEAIDQILNQHGAELEALKTQTKAQLKTREAEIETLRTSLAEATGRVAELSRVDAEALQRQLEEERAGRIKDRQEWSLKAALTETGCKDPEYVIFKLGASAEFADDGSLKDKDALMERCRQEFAAMFEPDLSAGTGSAGNFARSRREATERETLEKMAADASLPLAQRVMAKEKLFNLKEEA